MARNAVGFISLLLVALALVPALAHVMELPHKIGMSGPDYRIVQGIYRGWAYAGIVIIGALIATPAYALMTRRTPGQFVPALVAFLCIAATQVIFWSFTFPVNRITADWTLMPRNWQALRVQWEYSHAASAVFNLVALVAMILAVLARDEKHPQ
jgi:hypothetical protein